MKNNIGKAEEACKHAGVICPQHVADAINRGAAQERIMFHYVLGYQITQDGPVFLKPAEIAGIALYCAVMNPEQSAEWFKTLTQPITDNISGKNDLFEVRSAYFEGALLGILHFLLWLNRIKKWVGVDIPETKPEGVITAIEIECAETFAETLFAVPNLYSDQVKNLAIDYASKWDERGEKLKSAFSMKLYHAGTTPPPPHFKKVMAEIIKIRIDTFENDNVTGWLKLLACT